jgi:ATP-dependent helicase/nuclease subunit A
VLRADAHGDPDGPAPYAAALESDLEAIDGMLSAPDYRALTEEVGRYKARSLSSLRKVSGERQLMLKEKVSALRKAIKKLIADAEKILPPPEEALCDMRALAPALRALHGIAQRLGEALDALKAEKSALSYADLEHRAIRALEDERVVAALRARYRYVFVDEYQDVSDVQEAILRAVAAPGRLFMVGDVKQSIYRFRQADPSLFLEKYHRFSKGEGGQLVALKQNFRSRETVLNLVNQVFERVMTGGDAEIEYDDAARLRPGARFEGVDPPVELHILEKPDAEAEGDEAELTAGEREGQLIAARILKLVGTPTFDARKGRERPLEYRDFVVLVRTRAAIQPVESMLTRVGIPVYADIAGGYFDALEVELALALLRVIENRRRDLELMAALRAPFGGLTSTDLADIRRTRPAGTFREAMLARMQSGDALSLKLQAFEVRLNRWRALSRVLPLGRFTDLVLRESGAYAYAGGMPGGGARQANLDLLCDYASSYEGVQGGALNGFLAT